MKKQQFMLKLKKERIFSERIVEIGDGVLRYYKQNEPNVNRFTADLADISFYEKYRGDPEKYKVYISSKSNSFPLIRFKSLTTNDINPLLLFKNSLENFINSTKKVKKDEIVMRISKEILTDTKEKKDNLSEIPINTNNQSRFKRALTSVSQIQEVNNPKDFKTALEIYLPNFSQFKTDNAKYEHLFKNEFKLFSNDLSNDVVTSTSDVNALRSKLSSHNETSLTSLKEHLNNFIQFSERGNYVYEMLIKICCALLFLFLLVSLYYKNYVIILYVLIIYSISLYEFTDFSFKNISFNTKENSDNLNKTSSEKLANSSCDNLLVKAETIVGINIFTLVNFLIQDENYTLLNDYQENKNDQIIKEYFYNVAENKIIMTTNKNSEILNLYLFESNQAMTKTKIVFISVLKKDYPSTHFQSSIDKLNNFVNCVRFHLMSKLYFDESQKTSELDVYKLLDLEKESKLPVSSETIKNKEEIKLLENIKNENENNQTNIPLVLNDQLTNNNLDTFPIFKPFTNLIKITEEFKQESQKLINTLNKLEDLAVSDKYISDLLSDSNFLSYSEPFNGRVSLNSNSNSESDLIKQCLVKSDKKKLYRAKIKINQNKKFVSNYITNTQNKINFNKYLKDGVILKQDMTSGSNIQYQIYDFKILSKMRNFLLIETKRELTIGDKTIFINSFNSIGANFLDSHNENSERGVIKSSGYLVFDAEIANESYLGFWIECEISSDESLQDHALKEYLNHLKSIRDNINFDCLK